MRVWWLVSRLGVWLLLVRVGLGLVRFRLMVAGVLVGRGVALMLVVVVRMLWFRKFNSRMEVMVAMVDRIMIARRSLEVVVLVVLIDSLFAIVRFIVAYLA